MNVTEHYQEVYLRFGGSRLSSEYQPLRESSFGRFLSHGFPTIREEEWKYTNLSPLSNVPFDFASPSSPLTLEDIRPLLIAGEDISRLVFVNGKYSESLSQIHGMTDGVVAGSLSAHADHPIVRQHLTHVAAAIPGTMVDLNASFMAEGAFFYVPEGVILDRPVHFLFITDVTAGPVVTFPRNLFVAAPQSKAQLIQSHHTLGSLHQAFTNGVTEVVTLRESLLDVTNVQLEGATSYHIGYTAAEQHASSEFHITTITLDGAMVRNNLNIRLSEPHAVSYLYGLYCTDGQQLVDNHTLVDHAVPNCQSNELYKGILDGKSTGVFNGKIHVRPDAQKTNAYQSNKNVLLSDEASMNTKPQLEIFADDVKCSHGTTTGQLDDEALFYLRSRGIGEDHARAFLNIAFAGDIIQKVPYEPLRERLMVLMEQKLRQKV